MKKRILGLYIIIVSLYQLAVYLGEIFIANKETSCWFYFDPKIGLFFLESLVRKGEVFPAFLNWTSLVILFILGLLMLASKISIKTYMVSEIIMIAPSVLMFVMILILNPHPTHGFSVMELIVPATVLSACSIIPLIGIFLLSKKNEGEN